MISTDRISVNELSTWHETGPFPVDLLYRARQRGSKGFALHKKSVEEVQKLLAECYSEGKRFRALGSLWSLNDIAFNNSRVHANTALDMRLDLLKKNMHANAAITNDDVVFAQCGATVNQITTYLESSNRSLKVSGGSNGQTIAGAISTGVHGGAFDMQCISDYVKGLHLVIGPEEGDRVYVERKSEPVLNDNFAGKLNSRLIRDDGIFNAALVGLGSFGFIAAVVMEVEPIYSLRRYVRKIDYDVAIELMQTLDFENSSFQIKEEQQGGKAIRPYHFKAYINQYTKKTVAEVIYKIKYKKVKPPEFEIEKHLHPDLFRLMQWAMEKTNGDVIKVLAMLTQGMLMPNPKKEEKPVVGTLGDTFHSVDFDQPGFSWAVGVDQSNLDKAMKVWLKIFEENKAPGMSAVKLVRQSNSTIGFHKFPVTAVIHMDGVQWEPSGKLWPQEAVQKEIVKAFVRADIEFTLHWGKNGAWDYPNLTNLMYGEKDNEWVDQRSRLLRFEMADIFSNDFLRRVGLAGYNRAVDTIV